ncbi:MAG: glutathione S-transferase N-terminal domain-containing protein [Zetaproteobacteria bacterium]|nr:glutathione S-transferase N-terminal domain-containing protein [Zetaproteobacteria bacterium]
MIKLYSDSHCPNSHRIRIVLAEKELPVEIEEVEPENLPKDFLKLNPYGKLPTIVDRDVVFFEPSIVNEYLDERYPHPPLKPGSPSERAQMRLAVMHLEDELYPLYFSLIKVKKKTEQVKKIKSYLDTINNYMSRQEYFVGEQYSLADVTIAPILWRLAPNGIATTEWPHLEAYMDRLFARPAFEQSMSEYEQMLHDVF